MRVVFEPSIIASAQDAILYLENPKHKLTLFILKHGQRKHIAQLRISPLMREAFFLAGPFNAEWFRIYNRIASIR